MIKMYSHSHRMVQDEHFGVEISFSNGAYCLCIHVLTFCGTGNYLSLVIGQVATGK